MEPIYLDHAATTPLLPAVREAMLQHLGGAPGNPASAHTAGRRARRVLEDARERVADLLGATADEVVFTSGATEANHLALHSAASGQPGHFVASPLEHPSVREPLARLRELGWTGDFLPVSPEGVVVANALPTRLRPETRFLAVVLANHETGALQPVRELTAVAGSVWFHSDATQAVGKIPVDFHALRATSLALSAHKFHGPVGVGALLVRKGTRLQPLFVGGHQQQGRRPGTESVALAVGLAEALALAVRDLDVRRTRITELRRRFLEELRRSAAPVLLNGPESGGLPHTLNLSFPGCRADALFMALDRAGVLCSTGSACSSGSLLPSPVLAAMDVGQERLHSAIRFSFGALLTEDEVDEAARRVAAVVGRLRSLGPE